MSAETRTSEHGKYGCFSGSSDEHLNGEPTSMKPKRGSLPLRKLARKCGAGQHPSKQVTGQQLRKALGSNHASTYAAGHVQALHARL